MKRLLFLAFALLMVIAPLSSVNALDLGSEGPHVLAEFMPESVDFFLGTRIGEDFIAELDAISLALYDKLPAELGIESYALDDVLRQTFAEEGVDYDEFAAVLGNYAAIGLEFEGSLEDDPNFYIVVAVEDQQGAADGFLQTLSNAEDIPEPVMEGDNIVFTAPQDDGKVIITPTHLVASNLDDFNVPIETPLIASEAFMSTLETLPADQYNIVAYVSEEITEATVQASDETGELAMLGVDPADAGAFAFGAVILAGDTFTIDISVGTAAPMPSSTVSADFLNALPAGTDAFIVATDLTNVYNTAVETLGTIAEIDGGEDPSAQIPMLFGMTGLDLEEDVLSWTTGSYGIFFGADYVALVNDIIENGLPTALDLDFGIVIEATDPARAQNTAASLGEFVAAMGGNEDGITITNEDDLTSIVIASPDIAPLELEFVLTATDDFLFLGTRQSYDAIISGDNLAGVEDFAKSTQYYLPDANTIWYANADGFISSTLAPLAALGPAIENVFTTIVADLDSTAMESESAPPPGLLDMFGDDPTIVITVLETFDSMFAHSTISSSVDANGVVRVRATMTVNP